RGRGHGRAAAGGRRPAHRRPAGQPVPALAGRRTAAAGALPAVFAGLGGADRAAPRAAAGPPASRGGGLGCWFVTGLAADPVLRERLRDVYWIGGGSGAGKSTVARRLADQYGLRRYSTDDVM